MGASGGSDHNGSAVGDDDRRADDQGRRVAEEHRQSESPGRREGEVADDGGAEGIDVNRKTRRRLQRNVKKWANAHETHMVEPWEAPTSEISSVFNAS